MRRQKTAVFGFFLVSVGVLMGAADPNNALGGKKMALELVSSAFTDGEMIPQTYTGDGQDISPPLNWTSPSENTKSFCLVADDPDAPRGTWVHWVIYNIPPSVNGLPEGVEPNEVIFDGIRQGVNDFGNIGYGGPAPPAGKAHRYFFKLYALDSVIDLKPGATKADLMRAIQGRVIEEAILMGKYKRD